MRQFLFFFIFPLFALLIACKTDPNPQSPELQIQEQWVSIFNGENLDGWTPKIAGYEVGDNYANTFRVVDGAITVSYDGYESFGNEFGHLFYKEELSHYKLRLKYRFIGEQIDGGQGWAYKNSGVMYHGQDPATMTLDQSFPVCLEGQFLGGSEEGERSTGNLCTPGTHVYMADTLVTAHCINSNSETIRGEEWVDFLLIVNGGESCHHVVNGDTVFSFTNPVYGGDHMTEELKSMEGQPVTKGTISLQSESHPIQFKDIELLKLGGK